MKPRVALSISLDSTFNDKILYCNYYLNWKLSHANSIWALLVWLSLEIKKHDKKVIELFVFANNRKNWKLLENHYLACSFLH